MLREALVGLKAWRWPSGRCAIRPSIEVGHEDPQQQPDSRRCRSRICCCGCCRHERRSSMPCSGCAKLPASTRGHELAFMRALQRRIDRIRGAARPRARWRRPAERLRDRRSDGELRADRALSQHHRYGRAARCRICSSRPSHAPCGGVHARTAEAVRPLNFQAASRSVRWGGGARRDARAVAHLHQITGPQRIGRVDDDAVPGARRRSGSRSRRRNRGRRARC